jgi:hypothetical protein
MRPTIEVKAPKFDLYEFVTVYWNGETIKGKVVYRILHLDDNETWLYEISAKPERLYPEHAIERLV